MRHCEWLGKLISVHNNCTLIRRLNQQAQSRSRQYDLQEISSIQKIPCEFTKALACRSIVDFSGCRAPHLLVAAAVTQGLVLHHLLVLDHQGAFQECGLHFGVKEINLPAAREGDDDYHLLHGPTVVWNQETKIHIAHGGDMKQMMVEIGKIAPELKLDRIRNMWCMMESGHNGLPCVLLLLQLLLKGMEFGAREWLCLQVQLPGDCSSLQSSPSAAVTRVHRDMIPPDYGCIATCIATHRQHHADGQRGGVLEKMLFLVGTEHQQVVLIDGGILKHVISLQDTPQRLLAVKGCRNGSVIVAVKGSSETVSAYELTEEGVKERGTWNDISVCLSGDFAGVGCNQILLLSSKETLSSYFLSENRILHPMADAGEGSREEGEPHPDTPTSLLNILRALNLKKHTMEAQLTQQQATLQHKYTLLARTLGFMESLGNAAVTIEPKPDPGLVCLLPGSAEVDKETSSRRVLSGASQEPHTTTSDLLVLRVWQRINQGKHVVGMLIKNSSKSLLVGVGASVTSSGSCDPLPTESTCKVMWTERKPEVHPPSLADGSDSPPAKRRRLEVFVDSGNETTESRACDFDSIEPGMSFCLTVAMDRDAMGSELVIVGLWRREDMEVMQTAELTRVQLTSRQICSGELAIDHCCLAQWNGLATLSGECNFHAQETQDLSCLLATSSLTQVAVSTGHTELYRLPSMIRARLPLPQHGLQMGSSFSHTAPSCTVSDTTAAAAATRRVLLEGTALHIQLQPAMDSAVIGILYKCHSDLCLVVKLLRELLPGDLGFQLLRESEGAQYHALQQALSRTREELSHKVETLEGVVGSEGDAESLQEETAGGPRRGVVEGSAALVTTPTSLCEPRLEMATDAALSHLHA